MRLERVMCPANPGIGARNNNSLAAKSECPHVRRMRVDNPRLDRRRRSGLRRRFLDRASFRKVIVNNRVACHVRHVRTGSQHFSESAVSFHQNRVNDIERLILNLSFAQPLKDWPLCALGLFQQGLINEAAFFGFSWQICCRSQICLICEHDKKFSLLSVGGVFRYPRRDLLHRRRMKRALRRQLNSLAHGVGRSDSSNERYNSCNEEQ
jgi:hypothetical protein